jgi:hypothetical protein
MQPPLPRRPDRVADGAQRPQADGQGTQPNPSRPPPVADPAKADDTTTKRAEIAGADKQQPKDQAVSVRSMPDLSVHRDWIDVSGIVLTLVILAATIWQLCLLRRTLKATERAARAAQRSARTSERALTLINRAYLEVTGESIDNRRNVLEVPSVDLTLSIQNVGHTPATIREIHFQWGFGGEVADFNSFEQRRTALARDARMPLIVPIGDLPEPQRRLWDEDKGCFIRVWGEITYADYFKSKRVKRFALMARGSRTIRHHEWHVIDHPGLNTDGEAEG